MTRRVIALLAALALAAGLSYLVVSLSRQPEAVSEEEASQVAQTVSTPLYTRALSDFSSLTAALRDGESYTLDSSLVYSDAGALLGVKNRLRQPVVVSGNESFPLSQTAYQAALVVAQSLPVVRKVAEGVTDFSIYGLDEPALTLTVSYKDGESIRLTLGDEIATGGQHYLRFCGGDEVYLVAGDLMGILGAGLPALHALPAAISGELSAVYQLEIHSGGQKVGVAQKSKSEMTYSLVKWKVYQPIELDADGDRTEAVIQGVLDLQPVSYVATAASEVELARYGLAEPKYRILLLNSQRTVYEYKVGDDAEGGYAYMTFDSSGDIYLTDKEALAFLSRSSADYVSSRYVCLPSVTKVASVKITTAKGYCLLEADWPEGSATAANEYRAQGEVISKDDYTNLYAAAAGMVFDKLADGEDEKGTLRVTISFTLASGDTLTTRYYRCNDLYDLAETPSGANVLIRRERVDALIVRFGG